MFVEMTLILGLQGDIKKSMAADFKKEVPKVCKSKFELLEEADSRREAERERLFRLLLEEVQKQN